MGDGHYSQVARAIRFLDEHRARQPSLAEVAAAVGLSEGHLQRVFAEWAGVSPKRFLQALNRTYARDLLHARRPTFEVALAAGLSSGGRLYDLFVECEGVTPGEVARLGSGLQLGYGYAATPFGRALLAWSPRGLCFLRFADDSEAGAVADAPLLAELLAEWPLATRSRDDAQAASWRGRIFPSGDCLDFLHANEAGRFASSLSVWVKGTNFQLQVWLALLRLPVGVTTTYGELAARLGRPGAARAVGGAVGANPVGWLIPCHRVIRETGALGGYRWGLPRKRAMLACEAIAEGPKMPAFPAAASPRPS